MSGFLDGRDGIIVGELDVLSGCGWLFCELISSVEFASPVLCCQVVVVVGQVGPYILF